MTTNPLQNLMFCEKCQIHIFPNFEGNTITQCPNCGGSIIDTNISFEQYKQMPKKKRCNRCKRNYPKIFIKCPRCYAQLSKTSNSSSSSSKLPISQPTPTLPNVPKCPTCGSTNVRHISALNRAASVGIFGIFSGKIGKNYECLNCKAKW